MPPRTSGKRKAWSEHITTRSKRLLSSLSRSITKAPGEDDANRHFEHPVLNDSSKQIRLLKLSTGHRSNDPPQGVISFTISVRDINHLPAYDAVSYTWGDHQKTNKVIINNRRFDVSRNCWYALWQISSRSQGKKNFIWIDQICIDQSSIQERSAQVALMGSIYENATTVVASLGDHRDDSEYLYSKMHDYIAFKYSEAAHRNFMDHLEVVMSDEDDADTEDASEHDVSGDHEAGYSEQDSSDIDLDDISLTNEDDLNREPFRVWIENQSATEWERINQALFQLTSRDYFSRLWILQELLLNENTELLCGDDSIRFSEFAEFYQDPATLLRFERELPRISDYVSNIHVMFEDRTGPK